MDQNFADEVRLWQERLFARSIRRTGKLRRIEALLGKTANLRCLEISAGDGIVSARLRARGGSWQTAAATERASVSVGGCIGEKVDLVDNTQLPYEDNVFDLVVLVDILKAFANDGQFIRECHRVLKTDGRVIISEVRRRPVSLTGLLQRLFGLSPVAKGMKRNGYTRYELFQILKDGFDVPETNLYSNGLLESAATVGEFVQKLVFGDTYWMVDGKAGQEALYHYRRMHALAGFAYPFMWLLSKLEFLPGHRLVVKSKRRHWRPRQQPILIDGRSIAEAAINTKIGTAAPF